MLECSCHIISYLADVMNALRQSSGQGNSALLMDGEEKAMEVDSDWVEELAVEEDDSQAEDSVRCYPFMSILPKMFFLNVPYAEKNIVKELNHKKWNTAFKMNLVDIPSSSCSLLFW